MTEAIALSEEPVVGVFVRSFLILLFAGAALSKLRRRDEFIGIVRNFRILPGALSRPAAYALPWVELAVAGGLAVETSADFAALGAAALLALFGVAIAVNVLRGRRAIDCGCFRTGLKQPLSWWLVARNGVLAGIAGWLALAFDASRQTSLPELAVGLLAGGLAILLYFSAALAAGLSGLKTADDLH